MQIDEGYNPILSTPMRSRTDPFRLNGPYLPPDTIIDTSTPGQERIIETYEGIENSEKEDIEEKSERDFKLKSHPYKRKKEIWKKVQVKSYSYKRKKKFRKYFKPKSYLYKRRKKSRRDFKLKVVL